jgi:hypothetical protein
MWLNPPKLLPYWCWFTEGRSGDSAERRHLKISVQVCGGLPTRRYGWKFEDVVKSAQEAAVLVLVY